MKNFIDKILSAKYTGYIALVAAVIIVIIAVFILMTQFKDTNDTTLVKASEGIENKVENQTDANTTKVEEKKEDKTNNENKESNKTTETVKESGSEFSKTLDIYLKGQTVGYAFITESAVSDSFDKVKAFVDSESRSLITTDSIISIDISGLSKATKDSISDINAKIFTSSGKVTFDSKVASMYDKISVAVDELEASNEYYGVIIFNLKDKKTVEYVFRF